MSRTKVLLEWQTLYNKACLWDYGRIKTHEELEVIVNAKSWTSKYRSAIDRANKKLIENGRILKSIRRVGYQVVNPDDYLNVSEGHKKKGIKQLDTAHNILKNAPFKDMSEEARLKVTFAFDRSSMLQSILHGGLSSGDEHFKKKELQIRNEERVV